MPSLGNSTTLWVKKYWPQTHLPRAPCKNNVEFVQQSEFVFSPKLRARSVNQHCKDRVRGRSVWCQYFFIHGVAGSPYDNKRSSALAAVPRSSIPRACKIICLTLRHRSNLPAQSAHIIAACAKHVLCREAREGSTWLQRVHAWICSRHTHEQNPAAQPNKGAYKRKLEPNYVNRETASKPLCKPSRKHM